MNSALNKLSCSGGTLQPAVLENPPLLKIAIDLQSLQSDSRYRGIGRYASELVQALVHGNPDIHFDLVLNGAFESTLETVSAECQKLGSNVKVHVWHPPLPVTGDCLSPKDPHRVLAAAAREFFIAELEPDLLLITSLFEGYVDQAVVTVKQYRPEIPTATIFYDLIPLLNPEIYLDPHPVFRSAYEARIAALKQSDFVLAISASAEGEAATHLGLRYPRSINISAGCNDLFRILETSSATMREQNKALGIQRPFVLYTGGADGRKNLPRLIKAFAKLPDATRGQHQLVLAGKMPNENVLALKATARSLGLGETDVLFTGYVSDDVMVRLYNSCRCFVLPSLHEGFGLPALEALKCGALVIGANSSSIPEVIGCEAALFNPLDIDEIAVFLDRALTDESYRRRVLDGTAAQRDRFSWTASASAAIEVIHALAPRIGTEGLGHHRATRIENLLETARSNAQALDLDSRSALSAGFAHLLNQTQRRQLFIDVSELVKTQARTGVQRVVRAYLEGLLRSPPEGLSIEPVYASTEHGYRYARGLLKRLLQQDTETPTKDGAIVFQRGDLFLALDLQHYVQLKEQTFYETLRAHQVRVLFLIYDLLPIHYPNLFKDPALPALHARWIRMIAKMDGAISISACVSKTFAEWLDAEGLPLRPDFLNGFVQLGCDIPLDLPLPTEAPQHALEPGPHFLVVGTLEPRKGHQQVLEAFEQLWEEGQALNLIFAGARGWGVDPLIQQLAKHPQKGRRLLWIEAPSDTRLRSLYEESTCLILPSRDEGFGLPIIEAAHHHLDLILRDIPVFREVAGSHAYYFEGQHPETLASAIRDWLNLKASQQQPRSSDIPVLSWDASTTRLKAILDQLPPLRHQLLLDVSALIQLDAGTGIQRVVRELLGALTHSPPEGYEVRPVFATETRGYCYAQAIFDAQWIPRLTKTDEALEVSPGDVFFGLDMNPDIQPSYESYYRTLKASGIRVFFMIYDLLCLELPDYFDAPVVETFRRWLNVATLGNGAICISKTTAERLQDWLKSDIDRVQGAFEIEWVHLGRKPLGDSKDLDPLKQKRAQGPSRNGYPTLLMVGTIEPRKGHAQVLAAFERLWREGVNLNLVLVGKRGWMPPTFFETLAQHPEKDHRLFWYEGANDSLLAALYAEASGLIAASFGEGFGLPLIEAAAQGIPLIARDLPIFREVAGDSAYYFKGALPADLALALRAWQQLPAEDPALHPENIHIESWESCAARVAHLLTRTPGRVPPPEDPS